MCTVYVTPSSNIFSRIQIVYIYIYLMKWPYRVPDGVGPIPSCRAPEKVPGAGGEEVSAGEGSRH